MKCSRKVLQRQMSQYIKFVDAFISGKRDFLHISVFMQFNEVPIYDIQRFPVTHFPVTVVSFTYNRTQLRVQSLIYNYIHNVVYFISKHYKCVCAESISDGYVMCAGVYRHSTEKYFVRLIFCIFVQHYSLFFIFKT